MSKIFEGMDIGYTDKRGENLHIGDDVCTESGHRGRICFGIYGGGHYGVHIQWIETTRKADLSALREDFVYWSDKILKVN